LLPEFLLVLLKDIREFAEGIAFLAALVAEFMAETVVVAAEFIAEFTAATVEFAAEFTLPNAEFTAVVSVLEAELAAFATEFAAPAIVLVELNMEFILCIIKITNEP
jgi:hypothetical protein